MDCQLRNQSPALMGPMRLIAGGASQVAEISKATDAVRIKPTRNEL